MLFLALIVGTLVSEDLACISAGLLIREGRLGFMTGVTACAVGILLGDIGLWAAGRLSQTAVGRWPVVSRYVARLPVDDMRRWLEEHAAVAMVASRFMPGSRLPLHVTWRGDSQRTFWPLPRRNSGAESSCRGRAGRPSSAHQERPRITGPR